MQERSCFPYLGVAFPTYLKQVQEQLISLPQRVFIEGHTWLPIIIDISHLVS